MIFHRAVRLAVVARLGLAPTLGAGVYSSPPTGTNPPFILVGAITSDEPLTKGGSDAFYSVAVESWVQGQSPTLLDVLSDAVARRLNGAPLADADCQLGAPDFIAETDTWNPDAVGGPTLGRVQTFRIFAQPHD
ncbi:MAG: tail completion protein gp17 [Janthinobacterium lividum]